MNAAAPMRPFLASYQLRDGTRGVLPVLARSSCDAILAALDSFGEALRACSARVAS